MPVIRNMKTGKDGTECRHRLSEKNKAHTALSHWLFVWLEKTFVECNTWHYLKYHYGWADGRVVSSWACYYTKTSQEGKSGLFCPFHTPRWFPSTMVIELTTNQSIWWRPILQLPTLSDFASWIWPDTIPAVPSTSNTAEHTEQICSQTRLSLRRQCLGQCVPAFTVFGMKLLRRRVVHYSSGYFCIFCQMAAGWTDCGLG